jgi:hypothetical protein
VLPWGSNVLLGAIRVCEREFRTAEEAVGTHVVMCRPCSRHCPYNILSPRRTPLAGVDCLV